MGRKLSCYAQWAAMAGDLPQFDTVAMMPTTTATRWFPTFHPNGTFALDTIFRLQYAVAAGDLPFLKMVNAMRKQESLIAKSANSVPLRNAAGYLPEASGLDPAQVLHMVSRSILYGRKLI